MSALDHAITVRGLLGMVCAVAGLGLCGLGVLNAFANGMYETGGDLGGKEGCAVFAVGLILVAVGVFVL